VSNGVVGAVLASATTDAQGAFVMTVDVSDSTGIAMLRASGGSYVDEATRTTMAMGSTDVMTAVLANIAGGSTVSGVQLTPLTSLAQAMASRMVGGVTGANVTAANKAVGQYFMVDDILFTQPMNPLVARSGASATQAMMNYGMVLAAMSQYAHNVGMPVSSAMVTAMMADASDSVMDGTSGGSPIMMGGGMMGGSMMQPSAGASGLANAMADFIGSSANVSGLTTQNMSALMQKLQTSDGSMH
jgi:hypothetical protein